MTTHVINTSSLFTEEEPAMNQKAGQYSNSAQSPRYIVETRDVMDANEPSVKEMALFEALALLNKLTCLDSIDYQQSSDDGASCNSYSATALQRRIEQLQYENELQETPLPSLTNAIHHIHTAKALLQQENNDLVNENSQLRQQLQKRDLENKKLRKLTRKLQHRCKEQHEQKAAFVDQVKHYVRHQKRELDSVYKIHLHEHCLASNRARTLSSETSTTAFTATSCISNMSSATTAADHCLESKLSNISDTSNDSHSSSGDISALSSSQAGHTHVTHDGVATIRFSADSVTICNAPQEVCVRSDTDASNDDVSPLQTPRKVIETTDDAPVMPKTTSSANDKTFDMTFPAGTALGVKIRAVPAQDLYPYDESLSEANKPDGKVFIVIGYNNFDSTIHSSPPPIGSRFVSINGTPVELDWKFADLLTHLGAGGAKKHTLPDFDRNVQFDYKESYTEYIDKSNDYVNKLDERKAASSTRDTNNNNIGNFNAKKMVERALFNLHF